MRYCEQAPKPAVLLGAIRAIGYSFETAVADIIDNSLSAGAKNVRIFQNQLVNHTLRFLMTEAV